MFLYNFGFILFIFGISSIISDRLKINILDYVDDSRQLFLKMYL